MENRINISELLKDCPEGMELYSPLVGDCKFVKVHDYESKIIVELETCATVAFQSDGRYFDCPNAECILFPKGKTTWEGFQRPFKDGDVITCSNSACTFTSIFKDKPTDTSFQQYCSVILDNNKFIGGILYYVDYANPRFATEEEKEKLFKVIKDNGYKWNEETKTLEKLIEPKFKVGDVIQDIDTYKVKITAVNIEDECYEYESTIAKGIGSIMFSKQDEWDLVTDIKTKFGTASNPLEIKSNANCLTMERVDETKSEPKFKVGDKVLWNYDTKIIRTISKVQLTKSRGYVYWIDCEGCSSGWWNENELTPIPNKFDITTLVPFESKVLMRSSNAREWVGTFYSHYSNNKFYGCGMCCDQCIPYEGNEHLIGKTDDCNEYFKIWE